MLLIVKCCVELTTALRAIDRDFLSQTAGVSRPTFDVPPIPKQDAGELHDGLRKLRVAPTPIMD